MSSANSFLMLEPRDSYDLLEKSHWEADHEFNDPLNHFSTKTKDAGQNEDVTVIEGRLTVSF